MKPPFAADRPRLLGHRSAATVTAALLTLVLGMVCHLCWPDATSAPPNDERASISPPLFAGWVQPGSVDFGAQEQADPATRGKTPDWVLASEPEPQQMQAWQSALAEHPDKQNELMQLLDFSRFRKQVALWSDLRDGPTSNERHDLVQHLLDTLPAHVGRGELPGAQAALMAKALIEDLEPNPRLQAMRIERMRAQFAARSRTIDQTALQARAASESFEQQKQADAVAMDTPSVTRQALLRIEAHLDNVRSTMLADSHLDGINLASLP